MKSFLSFILFIAASASAEFETIIKDQVFKDSFNLEPDEKFVELEEGFTYYKTNISPECSEYYMLVHGFSVPSYILDPVYILLSEKSYCVIALDLYGRGFSENIDKPYTDRLFAEQTLQLLDHLDIEKATFLGLSNGGRVISMIANIKPESVNALIYVASSGFLENEEVVDKSVSQRGSLVAFNKLRFDFNSAKPISLQTISEVENLVNQWILENHPIEVKIMKKQDALNAGALAMFGEKYGDIVRVVDVPGISLELCGGTHVKRTSELGCFKIISELGISSGIRRIEALSGQSVLDYFSERNLIVNKLTDFLKTNPNQLHERVVSIQNELINKTKEIKKIKSKLAFFKYSALLESVEKMGSYKIIISQINGFDGDLLQTAAVDLLSKLGEKAAVILVSIPAESPDKILFVISFGSELVSLGLHAGKLINEMSKICSGGGGGRPNIAQAGAKDINSIDDALNYGKKYLLEKLID